MNNKGFTLVELSIVLVIIGLLIGGILAGKSMIDSARTQRLIREITQYGSVSVLFQSSYRYFPGDSTFNTAPGDGNQLIDGDGSCNGLYNRTESVNGFAHITEFAKLGNKTYLPFSTMACGGTDDVGENAFGRVYPYTEIETAASSLGTKRSAIIMVKTNAINFGISFKALPLDTLAFESKLGSHDDDSATRIIGIGNLFTVGMCANAALTPVTCSDPSAIFGDLIYYPEQ